MGTKVSKIRGVALACVALVASFFVLEPAAGHEYGYNAYYWDTAVTPVVNSGSGISGSWATTICGARNDIDWNTDFRMGACYDSAGSGDIEHVAYNYGQSVLWIAMAEPFTDAGTTSCVYFSTGSLNGECDQSSYRADAGIVHWNTYEEPLHFDELDEKKSISRHEMIHLLGYAHTECSATSVMRPGSCWAYSTLQTHDINDVNDDY